MKATQTQGNPVQTLTTDMQTLTIPLSILDRIIAVHVAGHDADRSSPVLSGVSIAPYASPDGAHGITIAATDGKILIEESIVLAGVSSIALERPFILGYAGIACLADWLKSLRKAMPKLKNMDMEVTASLDAKALTVSLANSPIGSIILTLFDGTFPKYENCLVHSRVQDDQGNLLHAYRYGINPSYIGRLEKLWGEKGRTCSIVMDFRSRGIIVTPLNQNYSGVRRGLVMPIILPT